MSMQIPEIRIDHRLFHLTIPALELSDGEILGIFGKSGAGKTSYLKRIRELLDAREVHYMSQFDGLLEEITVQQNIELGLAAMGKTGTSAMQWQHDYRDLLSSFEVDRQLHKYPRALSGGQRKRAEIVRSLIMDPKMLLLDEPFVGIGHLFESVCTREILRRSERSSGATIIVSHDFDLLCTFSARILLVDDHGVIGFIPTRDERWHPTNVRTAWTLGVENVLHPKEVKALGLKLPANVRPEHSIGFWARLASWHGEGECRVSLSSRCIQETRTTVKRGVASTSVTANIGGTNVCLTAQGTVDASEPTLSLWIRDAWALSS